MNRKANRLVLGCLSGAVMLGIAASAPASVMKPVDVDTLAQRSDAIVRGRARETTSSWSEDGRQIRTVTRIVVDSCIKGQAPQVVEVRTPGGSVGEISQKVSGAPEFSSGEEVIVFLKEAPGSRRMYTVEGLALGKFRVVKDQGEPVVTQDRSGLAFLHRDGQARPVPPFQPVSERAFVERLRKALKEKPAP